MAGSELWSIGRAAGRFGVSTRTLRYYEQVGLLESVRGENGYRQFDDEALRRLQQVLILRRLRIPLVEIGVLLRDPEVPRALGILTRNLAVLDAEINALQTVRCVLSGLVERLDGRIAGMPAALPDAEELVKLAALLPPDPPKDKEANMDNLREKPTPLAYREGDVRIIYLPPFTVAAVQRVGSEPEDETGRLVDSFIKNTRLDETQPGFRHFGFNHPNGTKPDGSDHGYERWLTIPRELEVEPPFEKKQFKGGLYAARTTPFGAFEEWDKLYAWVQTNREYAPNLSTGTGMNGLMEEHLDYIHIFRLPTADQQRRMQLDLLLPVKQREEK